MADGRVIASDLIPWRLNFCFSPHLSFMCNMLGQVVENVLFFCSVKLFLSKIQGIYLLLYEGGILVIVVKIRGQDSSYFCYMLSDFLLLTT